MNGSRFVLLLRTALFVTMFVSVSHTTQAQTGFDDCTSSRDGMVLSGTARNWQFVDAVGPHSGLLGREDGTLEAWIYPLKLLRDFKLSFIANGRVIAGESLPRTITVRPESVAIRYVYDSFSACETWFTPVNDRAAIIVISLQSSEPVVTQASFTPDVAWMWPAGMGDAGGSWNVAQHAFVFGDDEHRFYAIAGSPESVLQNEAYTTNYSSAQRDTVSFGPPVTGSAKYRFALAAAFGDQKQAQATYSKILDQYPQLEQEARQYYEQYLAKTLSVSLPDRGLESAYNWARISQIQGLVDDPLLGRGLIAGYTVSGFNQRPGFAWFFGRDSMWTSLALDSIGDFETTRTALEFLEKQQRADGKIPHEMPQTLSLVPWYQNFVYGFASADATPLYVIVAADYVRQSGDTEFAHRHWDSLYKAYQFLKSTYGANGLPKNQGVGHGWIEGGALLPVSTELYQAGVGAESLESLAALARVAGKNNLAATLMSEFAQQKSLLEAQFWSPEKNSYAYALDVQSRRIDKTSVLGTVPMWWSLLDPKRGSQFLTDMAGPGITSDWGTRIISENDPLYHDVGYHFGSVWPLFTGWASVAEYRYHRPLTAFANLKANAQMTFDGSLGRVTEVLSGHYYTALSTSSSHQIWSSAMVVSPLLRGMMGLSVDAISSTVELAPHVPADWPSFGLRNVAVGDTSLSFDYRRSADEITLTVQRHGSRKIRLHFAPALGVRARVLGAEVNGQRLALYRAKPAVGDDQHASVDVPIAADSTTIKIHCRGDFQLVFPYTAPRLGAVSSNLRIVSQQWSPEHDRLELQVAGVGGAAYEIPLVGNVQNVRATGAELIQHDGKPLLRVQFSPGEADRYMTQNIKLYFAAK